MLHHQVFNSRDNFSYNLRIYDYWIFDSHFHKNYELVYVLDGECFCITGGEGIHMKKNEMLIISPFCVHSLDIINAKVMLVVFSRDFIPAYAKRHKDIQYGKFSCEKEHNDYIKSCLCTDGEKSIYTLMGCLNIICGQCLKNAPFLPIKSSHEFVGKVVKYVSENLTEDINLTSISSELCYEKHYFSHLFHDYFNMNLREFINIMRFELACELLSDDSNTITDVATKCGYSSIRSFNRIFKSISAMTPSYYKNSLK